MSALDLSLVADCLAFPEGPVVGSDGSLFVGEMGNGQIVRISPDGARSVIATLDGGPNGLAFGPDRHLYCCNNGARYPLSNEDIGRPANTGRIERIDITTGAVSTLYDSCAGSRLGAPNDIVFDAFGGFWFTTIGKRLGNYELVGGLYHARADGSAITCIVEGIGFNGVGLSPDGATVYASASYLRWIMAFDAGPDPQPQGNGVLDLPGRIVCHLPRRQFPDSLAIEASGHIVQGVCLDDSGFLTIDPASGTTEPLPIDDIFTTNIAFGGADMRDAYATLSASGRLVRMRWPRPGLRLAYNG